MIAEDRIKKYLLINNEFNKIRENCFIYKTKSNITIKVVLFNGCIRLLIINNDNRAILVTDLICYGNKTTELCCMLDNFIKSFEYFKFEG